MKVCWEKQGNKQWNKSITLVVVNFWVLKVTFVWGLFGQKMQLDQKFKILKAF